MTMKRITSPYITLAQPSKENGKIGTKLTRIGAIKQLTLSKEETSQALTNLKEIKFPIETDIAMASLLDSLTSSRMITKIITTSDNQIKHLEMSVKSEDVFKRARKAILSTLVPLPSEEILARLVKLTALLKPPFGETVKDLKYRMKAFVENLQDVPADILVHSIKEIAEEEDYFPSWSKFAKKINWRIKNRQRYLEVLDSTWISMNSLES
tara:strand:- start:215 stop:847 length:633 start_codon:yes stop_codon:yes gene_type:complete